MLATTDKTSLNRGHAYSLERVPYLADFWHGREEGRGKREELLFDYNNILEIYTYLKIRGAGAGHLRTTTCALAKF